MSNWLENQAERELVNRIANELRFNSDGPVKRSIEKKHIQQMILQLAKRNQGGLDALADHLEQLPKPGSPLDERVRAGFHLVKKQMNGTADLARAATA